MTPERYQQVNRLLDEVLELEPAKRNDYLSNACAGDEELRCEVESLLQAHKLAQSFIETPVAGEAATLLGERATGAMAGRTLGHYRLHSLLGAGGMGEVYRAIDTRLEREVAVKILPAHLEQDAEALHRFEREAKAVAALSHPNVCAIHDFGSEQGVTYAVMELLEGETLRSCLQRGVLEWRRTVEIGIAVGEGLVAAHARGIIHRDLKPENIFLTAVGQLKILDFGLAKMKRRALVGSDTQGSAVSETTQPGMIMGTVGYMSPEQVKGETVGATSDIFSLGCVLYEMVSGRRPFVRGSPMETLAATLKEDPPALAETDKTIPRQIEQVIRHCLVKQPEDRYQLAQELVADLRFLLVPSKAALSTPSIAQPRLRLAMSVGAVLAVVLLSISAWWYLTSRPVIDSLAVLPLVNATGDAEMEYLSDGITESVINSLSGLPQIKRIIARSTMASYKNKGADPRKVGEELNVGAVLTGKMTRRLDNLIVEAELVNASDGARLWGERYDRNQAEVHTLQAEISQHISEKLRLALTNEQRRRLTKQYTENIAAYNLYNRGRYHSEHFWSADGFLKGIQFLEQAKELDPNYALAYAGLAATYYDASGVFLRPNEAMPKAEAAAREALRLDDTLAEAHTALAQVLAQYHFNWEEAGRHYRRAIDLKPNSVPARLYYGIYLANRGQIEAGIAEMEKAQKLDPYTPITSTLVAQYYYNGRRKDEAISLCQKINKMNPDFYFSHSILGLVYGQEGKFEKALAEFNEAKRLDPKQPYTFGYLGYAYASLGKRNDALAMIAKMKQIMAEGIIYVDPFSVAIVYVGLGEKSEAFAWLGKALQERSESLLYYKDAPILESLRSDPRFIKLLKHMGLAP